MSKSFCDLCGVPALTNQPSLKVCFQNISVDGLEMRAVFGTENTGFNFALNGTLPGRVDICGNCLANLLRKMADTIK